MPFFLKIFFTWSLGSLTPGSPPVSLAGFSSFQPLNDSVHLCSILGRLLCVQSFPVILSSPTSFKQYLCAKDYNIYISRLNLSCEVLTFMFMPSLHGP